MNSAYALCMMVPITMVCLSLLFTAMYFIGRHHIDIVMYNSLFDEDHEMKRARLVPDETAVFACDSHMCDKETEYDPTHPWFPRKRDVEWEYALAKFVASLHWQLDTDIDYMFDFSDVEVCNV